MKFYTIYYRGRCQEYLSHSLFAHLILFIGALTATEFDITGYQQGGGFQSAFHRGTHCYRKQTLLLSDINKTFSPLFIGALSATGFATHVLC